MDRNSPAGGSGLDLSLEQDDTPFGGQDIDDIEINFVDDEDTSTTQSARRGQNEDDDFFEGDFGNDDADLENASPSVKNRIMRERRLRMEAEQRLNAGYQELERAEEGILNSERQKAAAQRDSFKIGLDALDVRMQTAREALKQARADEDRGAEVDIESHMRELERLRGEIQSNAARIPSDEQIQQAFAAHREKMKPQRLASRSSGGADEGRPLNDLAHRWSSQNGWMDDPSKTEEKKTLVAVSQQIAREGLDPNSQEHFTELTRRMAKSFPNLGVRDLTGRQLGASRSQPQQRRASNPPPVGGNRGSAPMQNSNRNLKRVDLDQSDKRIMRAVGLDPSDKKQVAYFAKEKLGRVQREARNGGRS